VAPQDYRWDVLPISTRNEANLIAIRLSGNDIPTAPGCQATAVHRVRQRLPSPCWGWTRTVVVSSSTGAPPRRLENIEVICLLLLRFAFLSYLLELLANITSRLNP